MKLAVIGGGAIGMLVSSYLQRVSEVTLYVRRVEQKQQLEENGLILQAINKLDVCRLKVKLLDKEIVDADYIFLAVKQYDLDFIIKKLKETLKVNQTVVFLQNGMSHLKYAKELPSNDIFFGVVEHGALKVNDFTVQHTGVGTIKLAPYKESLEKMKELLLLGSENFPILDELDYYKMMSKKLMVNAVVNPLTAIFKVENGKLGSNKYFKVIGNELIEEISLILDLDKKEMIKHVFSVIQQTDKNRSSMLKDLENNRMTEVDSILGFLMEEALKKSLPCKQIHLLYLMVKGLESEV